MLNYYTLATMNPETGHWAPQFGDFDKGVVREEGKTEYQGQEYK
jgi:hypothetical protein